MNPFEEVNTGETMLDRALALWEMGFHIFPLGSPYEAIPDYIIQRFGSEEEAKTQWPKTPRIGWTEYQSRQPTEAEIRKWWTDWPMSNIAIVTGIQIDVIDADSDQAVEWCRSGAITRTPWENHTGRGVQFLYRKADLDVRNSANPESKLDTRGVGGYIVAPGSTHSNGKVYALVTDELCDIEAADELPCLNHTDLATLKGYVPPADPTKHVFSVDVSGVSVGFDDSGAAEGGRNNKCAQLAGRFINEGDDMQTARHKLLEWNAKNNPPLNESEIDQTLRSVVKTHERNNPTRPVPAAPLPVSDNKKGTLRVWPVGELLDEAPEKPESLWGGAALFKGARVMINGAPKVGKSRFALSWLAALARGTDFLGEEVKRPLHCLWLQAEIHEAWLNDRLRPIVRNTPPELMPLLREQLCMTGRIRLDITNPLHFDTVCKMVRGEAKDAPRPPSDVVCFDPMINFSSANENDNTEMRAVLDMFDALQAETGVTVFLVHHSRKGNGKFDSTPFDMIRGASALRGWYDTGVVMTPTEGSSNEITVAWELRNGENRAAHNAVWNEERGIYEVMQFSPPEEREEQKGSPTLANNTSRLHAMMPDNEPLARTQMVRLCRQIGVSSDTSVKNLLANLKTRQDVDYIHQPGKSAFFKKVVEEEG